MGWFMQTCVQLFRYDEKLTEVALGEPCVVLIECDRGFGLLSAEREEEGSTSTSLILETVHDLHIRENKSHRYRDFGRVCISKIADLWVVRDGGRKCFFPVPSVVPYHVIFLGKDDYALLPDAREK